MMRRLGYLCLITTLIVAIFGIFSSCTSYYHRVTYTVGLKDYQPEVVTILPAVVGSFSGAKTVVERQISLELQAWGIKVVDPDMVKGVEKKDLFRVVEDVQQKKPVSDAYIQKLAEKLQVDTFVLPVVVDWSYSTSGERKFANVQLMLKLVAASTGEVVWQYEEGEEKEYWVLRPELEELSGPVVEKLVKEMPKKGGKKWDIL